MVILNLSIVRMTSLELHFISHGFPLCSDEMAIVLGRCAKHIQLFLHGFLDLKARRSVVRMK
jgi:hypothetical protein